MSEKLQMTDLVAHTVVTKLSIPKSNGTWVGNEHTSTIYLPADAPEAYKLYRKLREDALQRRAIWETLYHVAGGIDTTQYLAGVAETEAALNKLEETYKYESVAVLVVNTEDPERVKLKLFEDPIIANSWLLQTYNVTLEDVKMNSLPVHLKGTRIFNQDWHCSKPTLTNTSLKPVEANKQTNFIGKIE